MTDIPSPQPAPQHSPGPWEAIGSNVYAHSATPFLGLPVAKVGVPEKRDDPRIVVELEANARLIAAAPELLEALTECMRALRMLGHTDVVGYELAELAIAKATGAQA